MGRGFKLAIELIRLTFLTGTLTLGPPSGLPPPVRFLSMSSKLLPWVSGTKMMTKNRPTRQTTPNSQKAPCVPSRAVKSLKVLVTINVQVQLNAVAREAAEPRILAENHGKETVC